MARAGGRRASDAINSELGSQLWCAWEQIIHYDHPSREGSLAVTTAEGRRQANISSGSRSMPASARSMHSQGATTGRSQITAMQSTPVGQVPPLARLCSCPTSWS